MSPLSFSPTTSVYVPAGRQVASIDAEGRATIYTLNATGQRINLTDATSSISTFTYDAAGR